MPRAAAVLGVSLCLLAASCDGSDDTTAPDATATSSMSSSTTTTSAPTSTSPTAAAPTTAPPTTVETTMAPTSVEMTASTTTIAPTPMLVRPIFEPEICTSITAWEGVSSTVHDLTLFARPSELPVPIQVIGDPVDGEAKPFALVQRHFDRDDGPGSAQETVVINDTFVHITEVPNGNGSATWLLADGSQGYLRSRGLDRDQIIAVVGGLSPRPVDAAVNGFDYGPDPPIEGLELVAEQMNTVVEFGPGAGSQCEMPVPETSDAPGVSYGYRLSVYTGDRVGTFGAVIDRPPPLDVGVIGEQVVVLMGVDEEFAPGIDDIIEADADTWFDLR